MNEFLGSFAYWLADFYLTSTVLLVAALLTIRCCRQPVKRLAVTKAAIVAMFVMAVLCALPGWSVVSLSWPEAAEEAAADTAQVMPAPSELPRRPTRIVEAREPLAEPVSRPIAIEVEPDTVHAPILWSTMLVAGYLLGAGAVALWLVVGVLAARRLARRAEIAPNALRALFVQASDDRLANTDLLVSDDIDVAVALGLFRPRVLLPRRWVSSRTSEELHTVLAHEAAHLDNGDLKWLAASRLLLVLLWAQPLYWLLRRSLRLDLELLADMAAAEQPGRQRYAEQLVTWAREVGSRPRPLVPAALGLWERPSQLRRRVAVLLDERFTVLKRCSRWWHLGLAGLAGVTALALSLISFAPDRSTTANPATGSTRDVAEQIRHSVAAYPRFQMRPGKGGVIEGHCVDENGSPLADVDIALIYDDLSGLRSGLVRHLRTDSEGKFHFAELEQPASEDHTILYRVVAWSQGRASAVAGVTADQPRFVNLELGKPATVAGRVTGADSNPVADALVSFVSRSLKPLEGVLSARTDSNGKYRVTDMRPISPEKLIKHSEENGQRFGEVQILQFQVEHPKWATADVRYGGVPANVDVVLEPAAKILGRVVFADSREPAAGVIVQLQGVFVHDHTQRATYDARTRTDSQGRYELTGLRRGKYNVWAAAPDWTMVALDSFPVDAGEERTAPDLKFLKGGIVAGHLVDAETGKAVEVGDNDGYVSIGMHGPSRPRSGAAIDGGRVNPDGTFKYRLPAGQHYVYLSGVGPFSVEGKDRGARELEIRDGETTQTEFRVRRKK